MGGGGYSPGREGDVSARFPRRSLLYHPASHVLEGMYPPRRERLPEAPYWKRPALCPPRLAAHQFPLPPPLFPSSPFPPFSSPPPSLLSLHKSSQAASTLPPPSPFPVSPRKGVRAAPRGDRERERRTASIENLCLSAMCISRRPRVSVQEMYIKPFRPPVCSIFPDLAPGRPPPPFLKPASFARRGWSKVTRSLLWSATA